MSINTQSNDDVLRGMTEKDVNLSQLDGLQLPEKVVEEILRRMQKSSGMLGMIDTVTMERLEQEVPTFGVPALSGATRDEGGNRTAESSVESGDVKFNATDQQYYIHVDIKRDAIKNIHQSPSEAGNMIIGEFIERWANDVALIGMRANASEGNLASYAGASALDSTFDGWIAIAEGTGDTSDRIGLEGGDSVTAMPTYDNQEDTTSDSTNNPTDQPVDTEMFHGAIQTLDSRYRDPDDVQFLMSPDQVQQYHYDLTGRQDGLGVAVLQGSTDVTPFEYDVVGIPGWPSQYGMLTDPDNLAYGLYRDMDIDQTRDTDTVYEEVLHSRTWFEGQFDFQIKRLPAGVLITGLADPLSN
jgi:hypothetical protein